MLKTQLTRTLKRRSGCSFGDTLKVSNVRYMLWLAVCWIIWTNENNIFFRGEINFNLQVDEITRLTWCWRDLNEVFE